MYRLPDGFLPERCRAGRAACQVRESAESEALLRLIVSVTYCVDQARCVIGEPAMAPVAVEQMPPAPLLAAQQP
jgi:hypothetical protein